MGGAPQPQSDMRFLPCGRELCELWSRGAEGRRQRQRLQRHLAAESRRSAAEATAREGLELALHGELTQLRQRLLSSQRRAGGPAGSPPTQPPCVFPREVWSAASPEELQQLALCAAFSSLLAAACVQKLRLQVVLSRWPQGSAFLQAAEAKSLTSIGGACTKR